MSDGEPSLPFRIGELIADKYRVESVLGAGGMGVVVAATHIDLDRKVAIKLIREELAQENSTVERLMLEAKAAARIRSEHVGKVLDVGRLPSGAPYIVMEYLEGHDLCHQLERHGALKITQAIDFVMQACEALAEAHAANIVHRDLKPENLFVARQADGTSIIKVLDFGISKQLGTSDRRQLTNPSTAVGSPRYMAPEQMQAGAVDVRADIWSLGAILYECMSNVPAFDSDTLPGICAQVLSQDPHPIRERVPHIPDRLAAVVERCMRKNRDERFANVAELAEALTPFGSERAVLSRRRITSLLGAGGLDSTQLGDLPMGVDIQAQTAVVDTGAVRAAMAASSPAATQASTTVGRGMSVDLTSKKGLAGLPKRRPAWPFVAVPLVAVAAVTGSWFVLGNGQGASTKLSTDLAIPTVATGPELVTMKPIDEASKVGPSAGRDVDDEPRESGEGEEATDERTISVTPSATGTAQPAPSTRQPIKKPTQRPAKDAPSTEQKPVKSPDAWDPNNFGGRQ